MVNVQHYGLTSQGQGTIHGDCEDCGEHLKVRASEVEDLKEQIECKNCGHEQPVDSQKAGT